MEDVHTFQSGSAPFLYPSPSEAALKLQYVGKTIKEVQAPAAIIDAAVVRQNCRLMLEAVEKLDVGFRAHVKTHKVNLADVTIRCAANICPVDHADHEAPGRREVAISQADMFDGLRGRELGALAT